MILALFVIELRWIVHQVFVIGPFSILRFTQTITCGISNMTSRGVANIKASHFVESTIKRWCDYSVE